MARRLALRALQPCLFQHFIDDGTRDTIDAAGVSSRHLPWPRVMEDTEY